MDSSETRRGPRGPGPPPGRAVVLYDHVCEICQAGVSYIRLLDPRGRVECRPIVDAELAALHPSLDPEACRREMHLVAPDGSVHAGGDAIRWLLGHLGWTRPLGWVAGLPGLRGLVDGLYRFVARNRYSISRCRGGSCRVPRPGGLPPGTPLRVFWACYWIGFFLRLPLLAATLVYYPAANTLAYLHTWRRRVDLAGGRLRVCFLGGVRPDLGPLFFGERFYSLVYDGLLIDPGSVLMGRSLVRHLGRLGRETREDFVGVVATHFHEEHVGNLDLAGEALGVPTFAGPATIELLRQPPRLPFMRRLIIGQPRPQGTLRPVLPLGDRLQGRTRTLRVLPAAGHSSDHVALYDPEERLLISGDSFMAAYFTSPNPDVDSRRWIQTLEGFLSLDIEVLTDGHGTIYTERADYGEVPWVVVRAHPRTLLGEKLAFMRWMQAEIARGVSEGLPFDVVEASLFPWGRPWAWKNWYFDELARLMSLGEFSRTELIRSFYRGEPTAERVPARFPRVWNLCLLTRRAARLGPGPGATT
ncbi:MAG: DUF393 domain-containing protein [Planctomycetes bacterium]|nr:DUF393 domain-containing protein [Planctomycetota bacterium]